MPNRVSKALAKEPSRGVSDETKEESWSCAKMLAETSGDTATFQVKYAGLVQDIRGDFDPSGRTDLLKILDKAKLDGQVIPFGNARDFIPDAFLRITASSITVTSIADEELLLRVPVHSIASIGLVREGFENILPIKIGDVGTNGDLFDLAVIYCLKAEVAEEICDFLGKCFSQVYKEAAGSIDLIPSSIPKSQTASSASLTNNYHPSFLTDSHQDLRAAGTRTVYSATASRSESADERTDELIKDYMAMLTACLSTEELAQYARLIVRWREGTMPMIELAQKLTELYGPKRLHLLTGMRCLLRNSSREDVHSFNNFIEKLNSTEPFEFLKKGFS